MTKIRGIIVGATVVAGMATGSVGLRARLGDAGGVAGMVRAKGLASYADMVVSLQSPGLHAQAQLQPVEMNQRGTVFLPRVLAVPMGTTVRFSNEDPFDHNVFSPEAKYDLGTWGQGKSREHVFDKTGVFTQLCRIHPEMDAYVLVLDTPYFAKTDMSGSFSIANVAPGTYTLVAWSETLKEARLPVTVMSGQSATVDIVLTK